MPTADELISPASIRDLARVLYQASLASQWDTVPGQPASWAPRAQRPGPGGSGSHYLRRARQPR